VNSSRSSITPFPVAQLCSLDHVACLDRTQTSCVPPAKSV
jgi:hypothetical protein